MTEEREGVIDSDMEITHHPSGCSYPTLPPPTPVSPELIEQIKKDFLETGDDFKEIAYRNGVEPSQVDLWHARGGWRQLRRKLVEEQFQDSIDQFKMFVSINRVPVLTQHLSTTVELQKKVETCISEINPKDRRASHTLERMSRALKNVVDTSAKILAVSEGSLNSGEGNDARRPLVYVGVHPSGDPKTIEAEIV